MMKKNEESGTDLIQKNSALSIMAGRFHVEPKKLLKTLKSTVFRNATNEELLALVVVSNEYKLNPLTREIYAFPNSQGGGITPVVSVDGWISILNRHPGFDGIEFEYVVSESDGSPVACTAIIHVKDRSHPVRVTEFFEECKRKTAPWSQFPRRMLRHKALIQGVRIAFGFSGIFDEEEARDIAEGMKTVAPSPEFASNDQVLLEEFETDAAPSLFTPAEQDQESEDDLIFTEMEKEGEKDDVAHE